MANARPSTTNAPPAKRSGRNGAGRCPAPSTRRGRCSSAGDSGLLDDRGPEVDLLLELGRVGVRGRRPRPARGWCRGRPCWSMTFWSCSATSRAAVSFSTISSGVLGRDVEPVPHADLDVRPALLGGGREVGQRLDRLRRRDGVRLDVAGLDLRGRVGGLVAHEVDLAADEVGQRRAGAVVRHLGEVDAELLLDEQAAQVGGGADAGVGEGDLVGVLLDVGRRAPRASRARSPCARRSSSARR